MWRRARRKKKEFGKSTGREARAKGKKESKGEKVWQRKAEERRERKGWTDGEKGWRSEKRKKRRDKRRREEEGGKKKREASKKKKKQTYKRNSKKLQCKGEKGTHTHIPENFPKLQGKERRCKLVHVSKRQKEQVLKTCAGSLLLSLSLSFL